MFKLSQRDIQRLTGLHPKLVELCYRTAGVSTFPWCVTNGFRAYKEQEALYAQGRKPIGIVNSMRALAGLGPIPAAENKKIVTWTLQSKHLPQADGYGWAFDFAPMAKGKLIYDPVLKVPQREIETLYHEQINLFQAQAHAMKIKIRSGTDWDQNGIVDSKELAAYIKKHGKRPAVDLPHIELVKG